MTVGSLRRDQMATDVTLSLNNYRESANKLRYRFFKFVGFAAVVAACTIQVSCGNVDSTSTKVSKGYGVRLPICINLEA